MGLGISLGPISFTPDRKRKDPDYEKERAKAKAEGEREYVKRAAINHIDRLTALNPRLGAKRRKDKWWTQNFENEIAERYQLSIAPSQQVPVPVEEERSGTPSYMMGNPDGPKYEEQAAAANSNEDQEANDGGR